jgi:hypothetical protein
MSPTPNTRHYVVDVYRDTGVDEGDLAATVVFGEESLNDRHGYDVPDVLGLESSRERDAHLQP